MNLSLAMRRAFIVLWVSLKLGTRPLLYKLLRRPLPGPSVAERVRLGAEELGITYLKLGQFLATRYDILPEDVCEELNVLFDRVEPMPWTTVRASVERELKMPMEEAFQEFSQDSLGAGSLAQVHVAVSKEGRRLAVKVQRANIRPILEADAAILSLLAAIVDATHLLGAMALTPVVNDFFTWTYRELDFTVEGNTADRLRANAVSGEFLPRIFWKLTTSRLLTMELLDGVSLAQVKAILDRGGESLLQAYLPGIDLAVALRNFTSIYMRQLFVTGFFHGDPHPGNILLRKDNSVAFVDCGIAGHLQAPQRMVLMGYYTNLATGDIPKSVSYYMKLTEAEAGGNPRGFARKLEEILRGWYEASRNPGAGMQELHWGSYVNDIVAAARENKLKLRSDYLMWARAIGMLNTNLLMFSVDFLAELRTFFEENQMELIQPILDSFSEPKWQQEVASLWLDASGRLAAAFDHARRQRDGSLSTVHTAEPAAFSTKGRDRALTLSMAVVSLSAVAVEGNLLKVSAIALGGGAVLYLAHLLRKAARA